MTNPDGAMRTLLAEMREAGATNDQLIDAAVRQLFLQMGELPSQNRVLELVRVPGSSPSTVTIQNGIKRFWNEVRGRMGVTLAHPEIPQDILAQFGEMASRMWDATVAGADRALQARGAALEAEAQAQVQAAELRVAEASAREQVALEALEAANAATREWQVKHERATQENQQLARQLGEAQSATHEMQGQLEAAQAQHRDSVTRMEKQLATNEAAYRAERAGLEARLDAANQNYQQLTVRSNEEIGKLKSLLQASDEKILNLRLDVDREVSRSESMRKELERTQAQASKLEHSLREQLRQAEVALNAQTAKAGEIQGQFAALTAERDSLAGQLKAAQHEAWESQRQLEQANLRLAALAETKQD